MAMTPAIEISAENRTIAVTAVGKAEGKADLAELTVGFTVAGFDAELTYAQAAELSNRVMETMLADGVDAEQIAGGHQAMQAIGAADARFEQGLRFSLSQSWIVTLSASDVGRVLSIAIAAGATQSGSIAWKLSDDTKLEAEACGHALVSAQKMAERMAAGLAIGLGPLLFAANEVRDRFNNVRSLPGGGAAPTQPVSLSIVAGKVTRSVTVQAVFALDAPAG